MLGPKARVAELPPTIQRQLDQIFERDEARGWKEIAFILGVEESTLRRAYRDDPTFRQYVHKRGGRYMAHPGELLNLMADVLNRREGGEKRRTYARARPRAHGRFTTT